MKKFFKHLSLVLKHKAMVFKLCRNCGIAWRGFWHDTSKFSFVEFWESVKYFEGNRSPLDACRQANGYSKAWLHHKGKNKHHLEYWFDFENKTQAIIPYKYVVECICDKIAATKCYKGKTYKPEMVLDHWQRIGSKVPINEKINQYITTIFTDLINLDEISVLNKKYLQTKYKQIVDNK